MHGSTHSLPLAGALDHRIRVPLVALMLAATFAVGIATGILVSREASSAGQGSVPVFARSTLIDSWRLAVPAVPAVPVVSNPTMYSWLLIPAGLAAPAPSSMINSWRLGDPAVPPAPQLTTTMIDAWRLDVR